MRAKNRKQKMNFSQYSTLKFKRRGQVLEITLNSESSLNAFSVKAHKEFSRVMVEAANDEDSEIIVLTGAGNAFSAGGDIEDMQKTYENPQRWHNLIKEGKRIVFSLLECEKPVIAKVNGDAIGLGATLALLSDVVIASETARFGDPHNQVALAVGDGGSVIWPQLIGYARAKHYLFTGDMISAKEAQEIGLIYRAVSPTELDQVVDAYVERLLNMPVQSLKWTKQILNIPLKQIAQGLMDVGLAYEALAGRTEDHAEAIDAFRHRRKPTFRGK
jgi:enoyl-CoA hydratase